jgi:hypothetical protein
MEPTSSTGYPVTAARVRRPGAGQRSVWAVFGTILAVVLVAGGLAVTGAVVLVIVAMSSFGSNK